MEIQGHNGPLLDDIQQRDTDVGQQLSELLLTEYRGRVDVNETRDLEVGMHSCSGTPFLPVRDVRENT